MSHREDRTESATEEVLREVEEAETRVTDDDSPWTQEDPGTGDPMTPNTEAQRSPHGTGDDHGEAGRGRR
ncbi:hypothetical protein IHE55_26110 [Streptomyces pactum]|uniref:Uncharacterized protein n=1 Tax=Streptomyces pactum TaxID=68249 RepID=A0ABS0NS86_9ACTN|nr:hypothetical protein [Streptomyces pactum]MBH5338065.1 hypothetical protein [Streptomyces pactum]